MHVGRNVALACSLRNSVGTEICMDEVVVTALGVTATAFSALSLLPQVIRTWRTSPVPG
jgi:hypothetical protein